AFDTTMSSPRTLTAYCSSGRGGGPDTFLPFRSYWPLWHAHQMRDESSRNWTVQSRCVQVAENARNSPSAVRTRIPGRVPNLNILAVFGFSSATWPATTLVWGASATGGGMRNSMTG